MSKNQVLTVTIASGSTVSSLLGVGNAKSVYVDMPVITSGQLYLNGSYETIVASASGLMHRVFDTETNTTAIFLTEAGSRVVNVSKYVAGLPTFRLEMQNAVTSGTTVRIITAF